MLELFHLHSLKNYAELLTGCCGAPGRSFAVCKMEDREWPPEEIDPSDVDFLTDNPAAGEESGLLSHLHTQIYIC